MNQFDGFFFWYFPISEGKIIFMENINALEIQSPGRQIMTLWKSSAAVSNDDIKGGNFWITYWQLLWIKTDS